MNENFTTGDSQYGDINEYFKNNTGGLTIDIARKNVSKIRISEGGIKMNESKIVLPQSVANAIAHYVALADSKHEAFTDILSLGYEAERSEIILRHFDGDYDLLMEALICGYEVEKSPEEKIREYYQRISAERKSLQSYAGIECHRQADRYVLIERTIKRMLEFLGITIAGVNADE